LRVPRPVDAEDRFLLFQQVDHRVQPLARLRLTGDAENASGKKHKDEKTATHQASVNSDINL
jgi:hypothetical protein